MQILIKRINETEPTILLNDVYMVFESSGELEGEEASIQFYTMDKDGFSDVISIEKSDLEYFRKVGK